MSVREMKKRSTPAKRVLLSELLSLCNEADNLIRKFLAESPKLHGKRPSTLKAAAIHYLSRKKGLNITLHNLYQLYGCHHAPVNNAEKIIRELDNNT